jgi:copper chaperone NosL
MVGCGGHPKPAELDPGDICAKCKMAISERRYAAEFADREGAIVKFDDIRCMIRFVQEHNLRDKAAAYFVMDYEKRIWLSAEKAYYVKSKELPSPMVSGLAAFQERAKAEELSSKLHGEMLTFQDLWMK